MSQYTVVCPPCGTKLEAASEEALIKAAQEHARKDHKQEVSAEDVRAKIKREESR